MQKKIKLLVGCPASGKSSWAKKKIKNYNLLNKTYKYISRDEIRFSMVKENEEYFSKETEVFNTFIEKIQQAINEEYEIIIIDATHVSKSSRKKVLRQLNLRDYALDIIVLNTSLETCLERNAGRQGRACVPESAIINMYNGYEEPTFIEFQYLPHTTISIYFKGE